jgi:hypothetical protein
MTFMFEGAGTAVAVRSHVARPDVVQSTLGYVPQQMRGRRLGLAVAAAGAREALMTPAGLQ